MTKQTQDEFTIWGMTRSGSRTPTIKGFTKDWNDVRNNYADSFPEVIFIRMEVAVPDKEALAAGITNGQLEEKARG